MKFWGFVLTIAVAIALWAFRRYFTESDSTLVYFGLVALFSYLYYKLNKIEKLLKNKDKDQDNDE